jgi:hypothetical protein
MTTGIPANFPGEKAVLDSTWVPFPGEQRLHTCVQPALRRRSTMKVPIEFIPDHVASAPGEPMEYLGFAKCGEPYPSLFRNESELVPPAQGAKL